jgi:hypothetical protein
MENSKQTAFGYGFTTADGSSHVEEKGLTKREYFAGLAMQGLLTRVPNRHNRETDLGILECKRIAEEAVIMADKLLVELSNGDGQ